ncbi:hypothetical protein [Desulfocurvus sp. DL9XJH121]
MRHALTRPATLRAILAIALAALLLDASALSAPCADEEFVVRGYVFQSERGLMLESEASEIFGLAGLDMEPYVDAVVTVVGTIEENANGEDILHVSHVLPDDETNSGDTMPGEDKPAL